MSHPSHRSPAVKIIISRRRTKLPELYVVFMKFKVFGKTVLPGMVEKTGEGTYAIRGEDCGLLLDSLVGACKMTKATTT